MKCPFGTSKSAVTAIVRENMVDSRKGSSSEMESLSGFVTLVWWRSRGRDSSLRRVTS